jgi:hypothetical protein
MRRFFATPASAAVTAAVVALLAGGSGYALASSGGTISACASKRTHVLYLGKCKKGAEKLVWSKTGPRGPQGAAGEAGPEGPQGPQGPAGTPGANGATHVVVRSTRTTSNTGVTSTTVASCGPGQVATGGGANLTSGSVPNTYFFEPGGVPAVGSVPAGDGTTPNEWLATWTNNSGATEEVVVYVVCASP